MISIYFGRGMLVLWNLCSSSDSVLVRLVRKGTPGRSKTLAKVLDASYDCFSNTPCLLLVSIVVVAFTMARQGRAEGISS